MESRKEKCNQYYYIHRESLEFSPLSSADIMKMSEIVVYNSRLYERETHEIVSNGPLDLRMVIIYSISPFRE